MRNVAANKESFQSSTYIEANLDPLVSSRAVDGDITNSLWYGYSCTHTQDETNPWWTVDLGGFYDVSKVVIYNRADGLGMCEWKWEYILTE
jgi:hypothetical protein